MVGRRRWCQRWPLVMVLPENQETCMDRIDVSFDVVYPAS
jgi:hypothetical protein